MNLTTVEETQVCVEAFDKNGNTSVKQCTNKLKIDETQPSVTITKEVVDNKNVLTATVESSETVSGYSYAWYKDGNKLTETTNVLTTIESGIYEYRVVTGSGNVSENGTKTINLYTITYNLNGGTGTSTVTHDAGSSYSLSSDTTLYAIWEVLPKCIRATELHTETCNYDGGNYYCNGSGYNKGDMIHVEMKQ